jgi:hypothetical protein
MVDIWHINVQKTKAWQMLQKWFIIFLIHINLMGELQCISNPSKVIKPFNSHYFQLYNTYYVTNFKKLFQIKG